MKTKPFILLVCLSLLPARPAIAKLDCLPQWLKLRFSLRTFIGGTFLGSVAGILYLNNWREQERKALEEFLKSDAYHWTSKEWTEIASLSRS